MAYQYVPASLVEAAAKAKAPVKMVWAAEELSCGRWCPVQYVEEPVTKTVCGVVRTVRASGPGCAIRNVRQVPKGTPLGEQGG